MTTLVLIIFLAGSCYLFGAALSRLMPRAH